MKPKDIYEEIKGIGTWFSLEDIQEFANLKLPKKLTILELGTGHGRSTKALRLLFPDAWITTCDPEIQCEERFIFEYANDFAPVKGHDLRWNKPLDLLFIDDDHMKDTVKKDVEIYKKFIKKGGYIVFHDFYGTEVNQAVADLGLRVTAVKTGDYSMAIWRNV